MTGNRGVQTALIFAGLSLSCYLCGGAVIKTPSVADCTYQVDPDRFRAAESRVRRQVNDKIVKLSRVARPAAAAPIEAESIPQRNFIDQEIFGKLTRMNVPSAQLSSDAEFLRRVTLDLTGRIPSSDDVRAFLADDTENKRDLLINRLLFSPEFADRWT